MIVSHRLGAAFIKTRKTGGTSIEAAMSTLCGPRDIITPLLGDGEEQLRRAIGGRGPQRHLVPWRQTRRDHIWRLVHRRKRHDRISDHASAVDARNLIGAGRWSRYFTFTIERNPWDKAVSCYYWTRAVHGDRIGDFETWCYNAPRKHLTSFDLYSEEGQIIVDRVLLFETLQEGMTVIWDELGVQQPPELPRFKSGLRPPATKDWRVMYTDETAAFIGEVCRQEIDRFGYQFDP